MREVLNFGKKWYVLENILGLISGSLPEDQGGFTCMIEMNKTFNSDIFKSRFYSWKLPQTYQDMCHVCNLRCTSV